MTEFAKGKWSYSTYLKRGSFTLIRLEAEDKKLGILSGWKEENEANARLIAAAPEMYEILKSVAFGCCDDCLPLMVVARELLARINAKENGHD